MDCNPPGSSAHGIFQARILEWVAHSLLQGIFPTQGSNSCLSRLLHWQADSLPTSATWEAMLTYLLFSLKDGSFGFSGTGHDWTPTGLSFRPESTDVANEVPSCPGLSAFCSWLWWLITQDVVGGVRPLCVGGSSSPSQGTTFLFLYKNNTVPPRVLTAHQIPLTVFLRSSAYFYSFGHFILGFRRACFGRGETYCFISGCPALMWTLQLRSGRGEDVVLGFRFAAPAVCPELQSTPLPRARRGPWAGFQQGWAESGSGWATRPWRHRLISLDKILGPGQRPLTASPELWHLFMPPQQVTEMDFFFF